MIPTRPYLIRALYEWIVDNDWTPHVLIDAAVDDVNVPPNSVNEEGRVVLNIGPGAVEGLVMNNDGISFSARFGGVATPVSVPTMSVIGIYARENGKGMVFGEDDGPDGDGSPTEPTDPKPDKTRPALKIVK